MKTARWTPKFNFFGQEYDLPVFAGPVGAVNLHYGDKYNDLEYNNILVPACAQAGIAAFTGDGTNPEVFTAAAAAIGANGGKGIPTVKPWDRDTLYAKLDAAKASGAKVFAMDIDAAGHALPEGSQSPRRLQDGGRTAGDHRVRKGALHHQGHHDRQGRSEGHGGGAAGIVVSTTAAAFRTVSLPPPAYCPPSPRP